MATRGPIEEEKKRREKKKHRPGKFDVTFGGGVTLW